MTGISSTSHEASRTADVPEALRELNRKIVATGAQLQATQIVLGALLFRLRTRRAIPADFVSMARVMADGAPRLGEPFDGAFREAIDILLSQIEPEGGGAPCRPKPKLTLVTEN